MAIRKKYQGQALGRGLDALLQTETIQTNGSSNLQEVSMDSIHPNPNQPRREFDDDSLQELANSIRQIGIVQPIALRDMGDGTYIIIAGERRWRASQRVGLTTIPAYIRTVDDENMMEMALVENIQRQDLTALEVALAYQNLIEQYNLTQDQLSLRVGKNRATVANYLRLLKLPASVQVALRYREIDMGHARALLSLDDPKQQIEIFKEIQKNDYSVRQVEELVRRIKEEGYEEKSDKKPQEQNPNIAIYSQLKKQLTQFFQAPVQLTSTAKGNGKISIKFKDEQELERIISIFDKLNKQ
jgi:ParB family chromosome partitioning protein